MDAWEPYVHPDGQRVPGSKPTGAWCHMQCPDLHPTPPSSGNMTCKVLRRGRTLALLSRGAQRL